MGFISIFHSSSTFLSSLSDAAAILDRHAIGCNRRLCSRRSVGLYLPDAAIAFRAPALPQEMRATTRVFRVWCKRSVSFMSHNHMALIRSIRSLPFANRWICSNSRTESSGIDTHHHSFPTYLRLPFTSTETLLTIHANKKWHQHHTHTTTILTTILLPLASKVLGLWPYAGFQLDPMAHCLTSPKCWTNTLSKMILAL